MPALLRNQENQGRESKKKTATLRQNVFDNATKRARLTLGSVMKVEFKGATFWVNDSKELEDLMRIIKREERPFANTNSSTPWDVKVFWKFVESLGKKQREILKHLLEENWSDDDLREVLEVETNQQLAGLLSGISKQAANVGISAREVYKIQSESKSGTQTKTYLIAPSFAQAASDNNWGEMEV